MALGRKTGGRVKGSRNKGPTVLEFLSKRTTQEIDELWTRAKTEDPVKALTMWLNAQEYVLPRLGRQEHTGSDGGAIQIIVHKESA